MTRLIVLSGPSCVGKGPLIDAIRKYHPDIEFTQVQVIKSRESRPGGLRPTDNPAHFLSADEIQRLQGDQKYIIEEIHRFPQVIDLKQIENEVKNQVELIYIEAYYTIAQQLMQSAFLKALNGLETSTVFLSPLSSQQIKKLKDSRKNPLFSLAGLMLSKQLVRATAMGMVINRALINDCFVRALDTCREMQVAHTFNGVLVNQAGEGNPAWNYDFAAKDFSRQPEKDAARAVNSFLDIMKGNSCEFDTGWTKELL